MPSVVNSSTNQPINQSTSQPVNQSTRQPKRGLAFRLLLLAGILVAVNALAVRFHRGFDLTAEKRFTLSPATERLLRSVNETVVVTVYLKNDNMGADFQRLADATRDLLESFRSQLGGKLVYRFQDPFAGKATDDEKAKVAQSLAEKGIVAIPFGEGESGESYTESYLFPYAHIAYKEREVTVSLLDNHQGMDRAAVLNYSESQLEYKIARALYLMTRPAQPTIGYLVGHGEALGYNTYDALRSLSQFYRVDTFDLSQNLYIPSAFNAVVLVKPTEPFSDKDKYKLDQYLLGGGRILMAVDATTADLDSLIRSREVLLAQDRGLNLDDLLFRWGARLNTNLVEDLRCVRIPVTVGVVEGQPQYGKRPWPYFPFYLPSSHHPIVNNMDGILSLFAGTIDTIATPGISKTVLLETSPRSRTAPVPARVSTSMLRYKPRAELYNKPYGPTAVLLEGRFRSVFEGRLPDAFVRLLRDSIRRPFKPAADSAGKVILVGDGDVFLNRLSDRGPQEMGYWDVDDARFANRSFLLNCLEYLTEPGSPLEARSKESRLRQLDGPRVKREHTQWQVLNILLPLAFVIVFASAYLFFRKRRYEGSSGAS